jgi:hypothetical protein
LAATIPADPAASGAAAAEAAPAPNVSYRARTDAERKNAFRARHQLISRPWQLFVAAAFSMFINETKIVLVFMVVVLGGAKSATSRFRVI